MQPLGNLKNQKGTTRKSKRKFFLLLLSLFGGHWLVNKRKIFAQIFCLVISYFKFFGFLAEKKE